MSETSKPHSGANVALIRESLISMQNMPDALHEFDRLVEQLEALRFVVQAAYLYYPKGTPMSDSMEDVLAFSNPASEPKA